MHVRGRRNKRDMFIRDVTRSGRWFPERVAFWSIRSSVVGRWFCVTGAAHRMTWHHFFVAGWRKSHRISSFLMSSTSTIEDVSQNCFVFDVIKFKSWGSLAELVRFWRCQLRKWRNSRRIVSFSSLQITLHYATLLQLQLQYKYKYKCKYKYKYNTTLHHTTLHYTTLITLQYATTTTTTTTTTATTIATTLRYTKLRYTNYTTLHCTTLHYTTPHHNTLHYTTTRPLHYNYITFNYATLITLQLQLPLQLQLHYFTLHYNYNYTRLHYTILHYHTL